MNEQIQFPQNRALKDALCSHVGPDCEGPLQTEHLTYGQNQQTTYLCQFHNQTVLQIRRLLALRKRQLGLRGKLDERQRILCFEQMRRHRFTHRFLEAMDRKCEGIAESLQLERRPDWYRQLKSEDTPKPGGPIRVRLRPIARGNPVMDWEWEITILNPEVMQKSRRQKRKG
jgi:hypothetical protein